MKKLMFLLAVVVCSVLSYAQQEATVTTIDGQRLYGIFIVGNDTSVTIRITKNAESFKKKNGSDICVLHASEIASLFIDGLQYVFEDGKFISKREIERRKKQKEQENKAQEIAADPNFVIAKALKSTGALSLGFGVPCLAAGLATCIAGHIADVSPENAQAIAGCNEASYYLLGVGAGLTIVGIPLFIEGKKLMELKVNYTGNGVGLSMNF